MQIKDNEDDEAITALSIKSQTSKSLLRKIFLMGRNLKNASFVSDNTLIDFHQTVDEFYKNCK